MGFACGKIPMAYATERKREGLGLAGMVSCVLSGMLGGCLLAMPVAMIFTLIIVVMGHAPGDPRRRDRRDIYVPWKPPEMATAAALPGPFSEIGPVIVCNECRHAHKRGAEGIPPACPQCGLDFRSRIAAPPAEEAKPTAAGPTPEPRRKLVSWREERRRGNAPRSERAVSARRRVAMSRGEDTPPPSTQSSDSVIELKPQADDPRGW
jgi:hypothetical protein